MSQTGKNLLTLFFSLFISIIFFYFLFFVKVYLDVDNHYKNHNLFKSNESLNFHRLYSKKLHHLRDSDGKWTIGKNYKNYLFTEINKYSHDKNNILLQGDSWIEKLLLEKGSYELFKNFAKENNFGLINAGITSFSPTLMKLQYQILEDDFGIKPSIVISYIDQTDIGDELCRYKDKLEFNKENKLIGVKRESHSRATYDYTKFYNISEILLSNNIKTLKAFRLTNFFIKYVPLRAYKKFISIKKYGWKNRDISKCRFPQIRKYLISSNDDEIEYFSIRTREYLDFLKNKKYIKKIILISFPHRDHIFGYTSLDGKKNYYKVNVSNIVDKIVEKKEKKITHLNFTKLIKNKKIKIEEKVFQKGDPGSHLNEYYHEKIFATNIINYLKKLVD